MEKVRPWCGQPSDRGRLKNRTEQIKLTRVGFRAHVKIASRIVSYRIVSPVTSLYKSVFAENWVATQKQYSSSINTNKIQRY